MGRTNWMIFCACAALVFAILPFSAPARAAMAPAPAAVASPVTPVLSFGAQGRRTLEDYARLRGLDLKSARQTYAASGLVVCGAAHGAGQLTLTDDVLTTAAHVLFDASGAPRAEQCAFEIESEGATQRIAIDMKTIVAGSRKPYAQPAVDDWAVARLERPAAGIAPYALAPAIAPDSPVELAARGHFDWGGGRNLSLQGCKLYGQLTAAAQGQREFAFDCETGDGASGGAVLADQDARAPGRALAAILVGWRSKKPDAPAPFSSTHYNFAVSVEGAFRAAVLAAARHVVGQR